MKKSDKYSSFKDLAESEVAGKDFSITCSNGAMPNVLVLAPHGGGIEPGTAELASRIAGNDFSFYLFQGCKQNGNSDLHVTSHNFDEPSCLEMLASASIVVGIHGCKGSNRICVGGLNKFLAAALTESLVAAGFSATDSGHEYPAEHKLNICNRGKTGAGAQLEISRDLRDSPVHCEKIAESVRTVVMRITTQSR